jgi:hypothetical protein
VPAGKLPPRDRQGRTIWVTRERPKIDRIARPWLIRRFVDPAALFMFVAPGEELGLASPPLLRLAAIVRGADAARLDLAPEAPGLLAALLGLSRPYADDLEQLEAGLTLYDAFYRWRRDATNETRNWPANKKGA